MCYLFTVNALEARLNAALKHRAREACNDLFVLWLPSEKGVLNRVRTFLRWVLFHVCEDRCERWQNFLGHGHRRRVFLEVLVVVLKDTDGVEVMLGTIPPAPDAQALRLLRLLRVMFPGTGAGV